MSGFVVYFISERLEALEKPLEEAREKVRRLEEDERTLTWMHKVEDTRLRHVERVVGDLAPRGRVRGLLMRLIGVKRPDMMRDIAEVLQGPVADELEALRGRLADARSEVGHIEEERRRLTSARDEISHAARERERADAEMVRRFEAPGRVRSALTRMVDDVFATIGRQEEAGMAGDFEEVRRLMEVEKAQRARVQALWRIDPVDQDPGTWTAIPAERHLPRGMGAAFPAMRAERATGERLKAARVDGCAAEIQRLEEEERLLDERVDDIGGCVFSTSFRPAGFLPSPRHGASRKERVAA